MKLKGFYGIADSGFGPVLPQVRLLLKGGVTALQLRCKNMGRPEIEALAQAAWPLCKAAGVPLLLNDFCLPHCADGVHLGQDDGNFKRTELPPGFLVGRSTHDLGQIHKAMAEGADYVGLGPIFPTGTKANLSPTVGLKTLEKAGKLAIPVVAIGGIQLDHIPALKAHGCTAWTAISAIWDTQNPLDTIQRFGA
jgi:thiamine-phosphate pyrophosphorylase